MDRRSVTWIFNQKYNMAFSDKKYLKNVSFGQPVYCLQVTISLVSVPVTIFGCLTSVFIERI